MVRLCLISFCAQPSSRTISVVDAAKALKRLNLPVADQLLLVPEFAKSGTLDFAKLVAFIRTGNLHFYQRCDKHVV